MDMRHTVTVRLPEDIYSRLQQSAQVTNTPVEELVVQSVKAGLPPSVQDLPPDVRQECLAMERLSDRQLRRIAESTLSAGRQRRYTHLLRKNQAGTLDERERHQLAQLGEEARRLTLRKAYAYALLKWRGHRIPTLAELKPPE
jgi:hypothetical protein